MHIELRENKDDLYFDEEFILNTGPLRIDLLIIKKNENAVIKSGLGAFFKKINIWEYKNPKDSLNVKEFNKGLVYLHLYIASSSEKISLSDVTLTFLRYYKPRDLIKELEKAGYKIEEYEPGIYHLGMMGQPNIQIIVSRLLDSKYEWVKAISDKIPLSEIDRLASEVENLDRTDRKYAITVLEFVGTINEIGRNHHDEVMIYNVPTDLPPNECEGAIHIIRGGNLYEKKKSVYKHTCHNNGSGTYRMRWEYGKHKQYRK